MSLFSSAVRFISKRKKTDAEEANIKKSENDSLIVEPSIELDFSIRNYAKESFSVLIVKPLSSCMQKLLRGTSFIITGLLSGTIVALVCFAISLQFGSVENSVISSFIINRLEKILPDVDLSVKSAMLNWNKESNSLEINLKKVRIDDFIIPRISILPDYAASFKNQKIIMKSVSVINPKIAVDITDDFKTISFNPNMEKGIMNKSFFEPISSVNLVKNVLDNNTLVKFINANVLVSENGLHWDLKNVYCEYKLNDIFPSVFSCSSILPGQKYSSVIQFEKIGSLDTSLYNVKINSLNPSAIYNAFARRNTSIEYLMSMIEGYNLPVSGNIKVSFKGENLSDCKFDLIASSGSIRLPNRNTLSLNLGKKIDNGSISGIISENNMLINSINISYGNSGLQLTGIEAPMSDFRFLDVANINGTLSLTNIDIKDMDNMLPVNISKSVVPAFKNYLPGFKLELFKIDLKGPIAFGNRMSNEALAVGQGIFKIHDAKIPVGEHVVTNVSATGNITTDGIDIKLSNAMFQKTKINSGVFFLSNSDNSWIGKVNADVAVDEISSYAKEVSEKLSSLPVDKLNIKGIANLDMKLVHIVGDKLQKKGLPFRIIEGDGVIKSVDNTKNLKLSWNEKKLSVIGDVSTGKNSIHMKIEEDFSNRSGSGAFKFIGNSDFLRSLIPIAPQWFSGNFDLNISNIWDGREDSFDINMNLKNATVTLPVLGNIKSSKDDGSFKAHVTKFDDRLVFSKMSLISKDTKINGQITMSKEGEITECVLNDLISNGCSAKVNLLKKSDNHFLFSLVGNTMNADSFMSIFNQLKKDIKLTAYLNLKTVNISNIHKMRNLKGTLEITGGKIIGGACIGVMGEDTTVALTAKDLNGTNDYLISISASNAGEFLKTLGVTDTVNGGNINFIVKSSKTSDQSLSGAFEIKDFIVKNNNHLTKLISLSSTNWLPGTSDFVVGFNSCTGNIIATREYVKIENCRAISPTMAISLDGEYDRLNDDFKAAGISLPISSVLNNQNASSVLAANYKLSGSLGRLSVSVQNLKPMSRDILSDVFGNLIPFNTFEFGSYVNDNADIVDSNADQEDPFSRNAFDNEGSRKTRVPRVDKRFGVTINRGLK